MTLHSRAYLAGMTDAAQQKLANDLTLGAGRLVFALRRIAARPGR